MAEATKALKEVKEALTDTESLVIADIMAADIRSRQKIGIPKYGTTVADSPLPLREWLKHAYEEQLDNCVYLRRAMQEIDRMGSEP